MNANYIELTKDDFIGVVRLVTTVRYEKMQVCQIKLSVNGGPFFVYFKTCSFKPLLIQVSFTLTFNEITSLFSLAVFQVVAFFRADY